MTWKKQWLPPPSSCPASSSWFAARDLFTPDTRRLVSGWCALHWAVAARRERAALNKYTSKQLLRQSTQRSRFFDRRRERGSARQAGSNCRRLVHNDVRIISSHSIHLISEGPLRRHRRHYCLPLCENASFGPEAAANRRKNGREEKKRRRKDAGRGTRLRRRRRRYLSAGHAERASERRKKCK